MKAALEGAVRRLFEALDGGDPGSFLGAFSRGAEIIHDDGLRTTPRRLLSEARRQGWGRPKRRLLSDFKADAAGDGAWVTYRNKALFLRKDGSLGGGSFSETAVLRRERGAWRFVLIHYSGRRVR